MTRPDEPKPYPGDVRGTELDGARCLRRTYRDALGRPMTGSVRITGTTRHEDGNTVIPPAPVTVEVVAGRLDVHLPPDKYELVASLTTADGQAIRDTTTATVD